MTTYADGAVRTHSDDAQIIYLYELGFSIREIAKLVHWSATYVRNRLVANGVGLRKRGGNKLPPTHPDKLRIAAYLYRKGLNAAEVAERMNVAEATVLRWLERFGQPRRSNRDATHCKVGHPLTGTNVYHRDGKRRCRACKNARNREWTARTKLVQESG